jgi:hypothetical protein
MAATEQQAAGLHPFVSKMKIVDQSRFPEISLISLTTDEWCPPVIANDFNIYTTKVTTDQTSSSKTISVIKLIRQNFHENYFTATVATSPSIGANPLTPVSFFINTPDALDPQLFLTTAGQLYLYYRNRSIPPENNFHAYTISTSGTYDLVPLWNVNYIEPDVNRNLRGMFYNATHIYFYYVYGISLTITSYNRATGAFVGVQTMEMGNVYDYCKIIMALSNENTCYITVKSGTVVKMATYSLVTNTLSGFFNVINNTGATPVDPGFISFTKDPVNSKEMCSMVYGFNNDINNILQIAYVPNTVDATGNITGLDAPFYYNINKYELFSEVSRPSQTDMAISVTTNPNNANFVYIAYVAGTSQLRVIKLYRNTIIGTYETHVPLLMWATRLGAIGDTFQGNMGIVADSTGAIYVITSAGDIWKIKEYILDLGHTEGSVVAPVDIVTNM